MKKNILLIVISFFVSSTLQAGPLDTLFRGTMQRATAAVSRAGSKVHALDQWLAQSRLPRAHRLPGKHGSAPEANVTGMFAGAGVLGSVVGLCKLACAKAKK